jgi:hypothetical protein
MKKNASRPPVTPRPDLSPTSGGDPRSHGPSDDVTLDEIKAHRGIRAMEAQVIRKHLTTLESHVQRFLTKYTDGSVSADDPDLGQWLFDWNNALARGEVPDALKGGGWETDSARAGDLLFYASLVRLLRDSVEEGLGSALPAADLFPTGSEAEEISGGCHRDPTGSSAAEPPDLTALRTLEAARQFHEAIPRLLEALRLALGLLASMDPEHLIRGARQLAQAREAGSKSKHALGIQAAVDHVYRPGMTERECWEALQDVDEESFKVAGISYEFYLDRNGDEVTAACQRNDRTGEGRSIKPGTFYRYFVRAQDASEPA